ncbi:MAG: GIY-YIG nuclease family protein [Anaerolineales bacterium]
MEKKPAVYILANRRNGTLYIGIASDLIKRDWLHKEGHTEGFSEKHGAHLLVHHEIYQTMRNGILREKQLRKWNRAWKIRLIEKRDSDWRDLSEDLIP